MEFTNKYRIAEILSLAFNPAYYYDNFLTKTKLISESDDKKLYNVSGERERDIKALIRGNYYSNEYQNILLKYGEWAVRTIKGEPYTFYDDPDERILVDLYEEYDTSLMSGEITRQFYELLNKEDRNCDNYVPETYAELMMAIYYKCVSDEEKYLLNYITAMLEKSLTNYIKVVKINPRNKNPSLLQVKRKLMLPLFYLKTNEAINIYKGIISYLVMNNFEALDDDIKKAIREVLGLIE